MRRCASGWALAAALALAPYGANAAGSEDAWAADLDAFARQALSSVGTPGAAVAVVQGDHVLLRGYGVRTVGRPEPVDPDTVFAIASNTKLFTGTILAMLDNEGVLSLDDPLVKRLPDLKFAEPYVTRNATILDALAHRTGLAGVDMGWTLRPEASRREILAQVAIMPLATSFRAGWRYSNVMYTAAGETVLAATGKTWDQMVQERILQPLGMSRSSTSVTALLGMKNVASPHALRHGRTVAIPYRNVDNIAPAGGVNASARDMAQWCKLQVNEGVVDGRRVVAEAVIEKTRQPYVARPLERNSEFKTGAIHVSYGLGIGRRDYLRTWTLLSHTGGIDGMLSSVLIVPEAKLCVATMTNRTGGRGLELALGHWVVEHVLDVPDKTDWLGRLRASAEQAAAEEERGRAALEAGRKSTPPSLPLKAYAGTYQHPLGTLTIGRDSKGLTIVAGLRRGRLTPYGGDTFTTDWEGEVAVPDRLTFVPAAQGGAMRLDGVLEGQAISFNRP